MPNRLTGVYPERITVPGSGRAGYQLYVWENRTTTQAELVNEDGASITQPVFSDAAGIFEVHPYSDGALYTVAILDPDGVMLPGYPRNDVPAIGGDLGTAAGLPFTPTDLIPANNVQAAVEMVGALANGQAGLVQRALTPWPTSGTGNAFTITPDPALTAYVAATVLMIRPNRANTGAATLNANGLGTREIRKMSFTTPGVTLPLDAGDLQPSRAYLLVDDGSRFIVTLPAPATVVSGANGTATYHADGRLVCRRNVTPDFTAASPTAYAFQAAFAERPRVWLSVSRNTAIADGTTTGILRDTWVMATGAGWSLSFPTTPGAVTTFTIDLVAEGVPA